MSEPENKQDESVSQIGDGVDQSSRSIEQQENEISEIEKNIEKDIEIKLDTIATELDEFNYIRSNFAPFIAFILLFLWVLTAITLLFRLYPEVTPPDDTQAVSSVDNAAPPSGMVLVHTSVGGLVSALIITILATSKPGGNPAQRFPIFGDIRHKLVDVRRELYERGYISDTDLREISSTTSVKKLVDRLKDADGNFALPHRLVEKYIKIEANFVDRRKSVQGLYQSMIYVYVSIWALTGGFALIWAVIFGFTSNETIHATGTNWLGVAVASTYAYFGIDPQETDEIMASTP